MPFNCIPLEDRAAWEAALDGIPHTFGHTWVNCHAVSLTTGHRTFLWHLETDGARVACPFIEREWRGAVDIAKPFGFSGFVGNGPCPSLADLWHSFVRERGYVCGYLALNPLLQSPGPFPPAEVMQYDSVHVIPTTGDDARLWSHLSSNRRRELRSWRDVEPRVCQDRDELTRFLLRHFAGDMERKGAAGYYRFNQDTLAVLCASPATFLAGLGPDDEPTSVVLCARTACAGDLLFNVSAPGSPEYSGLLYWHAIRRMRDLGVPWFNLGGGGPAIGEYKRRFGSVVHPLQNLKQVYDPKAYERLCLESGRPTDPASGYFPAYRETA